MIEISVLAQCYTTDAVSCVSNHISRLLSLTVYSDVDEVKIGGIQ